MTISEALDRSIARAKRWEVSQARDEAILADVRAGKVIEAISRRHGISTLHIARLSRAGQAKVIPRVKRNIPGLKHNTSAVLSCIVSIQVGGGQMLTAKEIGNQTGMKETQVANAVRLLRKKGLLHPATHGPASFAATEQGFMKAGGK